MAEPAPRAVICAQCGAAFTCSGDTKCWCMDAPFRLPMPDAEAAGDCLCPACLRERARQIGADRHRTVT
ncbi:MAG: cysteine-rich CWC family protein [Proteobacteria bacterium]|nr:cysteine-rich CWC family protein [Pseudomonadota bacterium]